MIYGRLDSFSYPPMFVVSMRQEGWEVGMLALHFPPSLFLRLTGHSREMKFNYNCNKA